MFFESYSSSDKCSCDKVSLELHKQPDKKNAIILAVAGCDDCTGTRASIYLTYKNVDMLLKQLKIFQNELL